MNDAIYLYFCVPHRGVPQGNTACLAGECLQASAEVRGLKDYIITVFDITRRNPTI